MTVSQPSATGAGLDRDPAIPFSPALAYRLRIHEPQSAQRWLQVIDPQDVTPLAGKFYNPPFDRMGPIGRKVSRFETKRRTKEPFFGAGGIAERVVR
ncbi:MAG TPA: hypothetical protein VFY93_17620 [Planctomycetota bacterium]|nr:hypothetical protein [Planctomycetota bacterium]